MNFKQYLKSFSIGVVIAVSVILIIGNNTVLDLIIIVVGTYAVGIIIYLFIYKELRRTDSQKG